MAVVGPTPRPQLRCTQHAGRKGPPRIMLTTMHGATRVQLLLLALAVCVSPWLFFLSPNQNKVSERDLLQSLERSD
jgi:hypothetical protein